MSFAALRACFPKNREVMKHRFVFAHAHEPKFEHLFVFANLFSVSFFSALRASFWFKNKGGAGPPGPSPGFVPVCSYVAHFIFFPLHGIVHGWLTF